jgi:hypothetical protein
MSQDSPIPDYEHVFGPETTAAMGAALEQVCHTLRIDHDAVARELIATRIIELAKRGERDAKKLRDRVLMETGGSGL